MTVFTKIIKLSVMIMLVFEFVKKSKMMQKGDEIGNNILRCDYVSSSCVLTNSYSLKSGFLWRVNNCKRTEMVKKFTQILLLF